MAVSPAPLAGNALAARGIARMAAAGEALGQGHHVEFRSIDVRSILGRSVSRRHLPFTWSVNPYRGCEFACRYCYARYTHEYLELRRPEDFERKIFLKQNAAWLFEQELRQVRAGEQIAIGTATDPYQPIERKAKLTQSLLEVLARQHGLSIGIVTKSTMVERDIPLLLQIAERNTLVLHQTITTPDAALARLLEPRAPAPRLRFRTVSRLRQAGLRAGILASPMLPFLTDTAEALDTMASKAKAADASFFDSQPLFLKPCSKETYLNFVHEHFPELEENYRRRFADSSFASKAYQGRLAALVEATCARHGLARRKEEAEGEVSESLQELLPLC